MGGFIEIDDGMRTNVPGVWAIGDVTGKLALAYVPRSYSTLTSGSERTAPRSLTEQRDGLARADLSGSLAYDPVRCARVMARGIGLITDYDPETPRDHPAKWTAAEDSLVNPRLSYVRFETLTYDTTPGQWEMGATWILKGRLGGSR